MQRSRFARRQKSRAVELPQRQSPRFRTSTLNSDGLRHSRPITELSTKVGERRSPRSTTPPDPLNKKKLGTRIADLESQLGQAQQELKLLKGQLSSAEAAKKEAQKILENKSKKPTCTLKQEKEPEIQESTERESRDEVPGENQLETDVFEVPMAIKPEVSQVTDHTKSDVSNSEQEKSSSEDTNTIKAKLEGKEREVEILGKENENLKNQLKETALSLSSVQDKEEETSSLLKQTEKELEASKANAAELKKDLETIERMKEELEEEMNKMRVQTEQWRKAADAAASVLAGGADTNSRKCGSVDKHFGGFFEQPSGAYTVSIGSPVADDIDDGFGSGKRKNSGIKMFGDLWRKKGQK